jgi:hypothetical protein
LTYDGAELTAMLEVKRNLAEVIDKMANTGGVRGTEGKTMSGIAMVTEFQLLNSKLSAKADNLELAEEQVWQIFANYQGMTWDGEIEYPGSFDIRDVEMEFRQLQIAKSTATDPAVFAVIDQHLLEALGEDDQPAPVTVPGQGEHPSLANSSRADRLSHIQDMLMEGYANDEILALHPEVTLDDIIAAGAAAAAAN